MWTSVYISVNEEKIASVKEILKQKNIIYMVKTSAKINLNDDICYNILVPKAEVEQALESIISL